MLGALGWSAAIGPVAAEPLSRAQAVDQALRANPTIARSLATVESYAQQIREARAGALPEIRLMGVAQRSLDPAILNSSSFDSFPPELRDSLVPVPANLFELFTEIRQTLYSPKVGKAITAAELAEALGRAQVRQARQEVALLAMRTYDDLLLSLAQVRVAEKAVRQKEQHLAMARHRRQAGVATELEVLRSQVDLENARTQLLRFQGQADLARGRLNAVMVRPIDLPIDPVDGLRHAPMQIGLAEAIQAAWSRRPEVEINQLQRGIAEALVGIERAEARPRLDFEGHWGTSVRQPEFLFQSDYHKWDAQVIATVPIFDGWRTAGRVGQAQAELTKIEQDRIELENQIRLEAKQAVDRLAVARSIFEAAELNVVQAQQALDLTQANYRFGAATTLDVLDAQAALTLAESTRIEALHAHGLARASLRFVMGDDPLEPEASP